MSRRNQQGRRVYCTRIVRGPYKDAVQAHGEAVVELEAKVAGRLNGRFMTLTDFAQRWLKLRVPRLKPSTVAKYMNDLERHILPALGDIQLVDLRPSDVQAFLDVDPGAPHSKKGRLALLRAMSKDALVDGLVNLDFCARVSVSIPPTYTNAEPNCLNGRQLDLVIAQISRYWLDLICVLVFSGMRWGEASALMWPALDIDGDDGVARIEWTNWKGRLQEPKNHRARRDIPLAKPLPEMLRRRRERMVAEDHPGLASDLVFPTARGTLHRGSPLRAVLNAACERAGISFRFTTHGLRRTFNDIARRVVRGQVVRAVVGHGSDAMTDHYSNVDMEEKRTAAEAVVSEVDPQLVKRLQLGADPGADPGADGADTPSDPDPKDQ